MLKIEKALCSQRINLKMKSKKYNQHLLSEISVFDDVQYGAAIKLINWEHIDYIEDVLAEHFDMDCEFKVVDDENKKYVLYFESIHSLEEVKRVVSAINNYHRKEHKLYETV